ncbi:MAG: trehalose-phosphatase [Vicinamibacteria bacterium]
MTQTNETQVPPFENRWALFLDVDGTLLDFVVNPDELIANPTLIDLLGELYRLTEGAVALVSGRTIASVDAIFEPLRLPIAGLHGHERRDALGRTHGTPTQSVEERFLSAARQKFNELVGQHHGSFVEDKGAAIALHYRLAPSAAADVEKLAGEFEMQLPESLCVQRGKMVVEIRVCNHSKGSAIEAFMSEPPFKDRRPVFVGDDATDEYGFQWVNEHRGLSIKVGPDSSSARFRFECVEEVVGWLEDYAHFLRKAESESGHVS